MSRRSDENHLYRLLQNDLLTKKEYEEEMKIVNRYWDEIRADADYDVDNDYDSEE